MMIRNIWFLNFYTFYTLVFYILAKISVFRTKLLFVTILCVISVAMVVIMYLYAVLYYSAHAKTTDAAADEIRSRGASSYVANDADKGVSSVVGVKGGGRSRHNSDEKTQVNPVVGSVSRTVST